MSRICFATKKTIQKNKQELSIFKGLSALDIEFEIKVPRFVDPKQYSIVVFHSLAGENNNLAERCRRAGVPFYVFDLGFIKRASLFNDYEGYHQLSRNGLANISWGKYPGDRLEQLGVLTQPSAIRNGHVLICGQKYGDKQHNLGAAEMEKVVKEMYQYIKMISPETKVVYRPHPMQAKITATPTLCDEVEDPLRVPADVSLASCRAIATYNSTICVDAIAQGIPFFTMDRRCSYAEYGAATLLELLSGYAKDIITREEFLRRVSYTQWSLEEFAEGLPFKHMLAYEEMYNKELGVM